MSANQGMGSDLEDLEAAEMAKADGDRKEPSSQQEDGKGIVGNAVSKNQGMVDKELCMGMDPPIKKEADKSPKMTSKATTKLHLKRFKKLLFVTACFLLLRLYLLWLFVSGN